MPSPTDATAAALLREGRNLFARRGYDGASIRAITRAAGTNLGAVSYHYGSKRELYEAVLREVLGAMAGRLGQAVSSEGSSLDRVSQVVRAFFAHLGENPDMPQLILQEIASGKAPPEPVRDTFRQLLGSMVGVIREGQAAGEIRPGEPALMALGCVAQPIHTTLIGPWVPHLMGLDPGDTAARETLVEHAVAFARGGLAAEGGGGA